MAGIDDVSVREARRRLEVISGDEEERIRAMLREKAQRDEKSLLNWAQRQGKAEGLEQGRLEGEAAVLRRQLTRRFGPLSPQALNRIQSADLATLECWTDRIFDAASVEAVFGED